MNAANKVALNTIILYAKMLVTMGISLYSTRLVLNALGATDYGIFNLIAGVIAMLSFLNAAMTVSTQRYLSYHQGTGDFEMQKKVFTNSWILHIIIGIIVVGLLLSLIPFLFDGFLNIPIDRVSVAKTLYYFMSIAVFFSIVSVPFTASLNAHENMLWIAIVNIIESMIKLGIALSLVWFIQSERLTIYGISMAGLGFVTFLLYASYCIKRYNECSISNYQMDKPLLKELGSYAGWSLGGALSYNVRMQGIAVIFNVFFNTIINAAFGIAIQVFGQISFLSVALLRAFNPQIVKSEGMNDRQRMMRLSMMASKFGFFLVAIIAIPCIFEMSSVLKFWLKNVPEYTEMFCSLILIALLINQLTVGLQTAAHAIGKIKYYQIIISFIYLLNLPFTYILLKAKFPINSVLICFIFIELSACFFRVFYLKKIAKLSIKEYLNKVVLWVVIPSFVSILICKIIVTYLSIEYRFVFTIIASAIAFTISIYFIGLSKDEKLLINEMIRRVIGKRYQKK
ncbi:MAG: hypothetical protein LBV43_09795 [Prevotella sp.]|jgi:Na+-driven multidrug efflux pump|nr:hypothetical protein [Prevotella sp.]